MGSATGGGGSFLSRRRGASVGDQALAGEVTAGLFERQVGRRQDHVRALQLVVVDARAGVAHVVDQRLVGRRKLLLAPALNGRDDGALELVEAVQVLSG